MTNKHIELPALSDEQIKQVLTNSDLWDMHQHMGWYSAPEKNFKTYGVMLARDLIAARDAQWNEATEAQQRVLAEQAVPSEAHDVVLEALRYIGDFMCDEAGGDDWHLKHVALDALEKIEVAHPEPANGFGPKLMPQVSGFTHPEPVAPPAREALSFNCSNGCGACGVKLVDFVTHATQAQDSDQWVAVASEPQIVSTCCGSAVEVWDERKQDIVGEVSATTPAPAGQDKEDAERLQWLFDNAGCICVKDSQWQLWFDLPDVCYGNPPTELRSAIDAARAARGDEVNQK